MSCYAYKWYLINNDKVPINVIKSRTHSNSKVFFVQLKICSRSQNLSISVKCRKRNRNFLNQVLKFLSFNLPAPENRLKFTYLSSGCSISISPTHNWDKECRTKNRIALKHEKRGYFSRQFQKYYIFTMVRNSFILLN